MATLEAQGRAGTWIYTGNPADSARDWVRDCIGDKNPYDQIASDEEIASAIADGGSKQLGAIVLCDRLAAFYAHAVDVTTTDGAGNTRTESPSSRAATFMRLAAKLRETGGGVGALTIGGTPYAGGISIGDTQNREADTDRVEPAFTTGMSDYR